MLQIHVRLPHQCSVFCTTKYGVFAHKHTNRHNKIYFESDTRKSAISSGFTGEPNCFDHGCVLSVSTFFFLIYIVAILIIGYIHCYVRQERYQVYHRQNIHHPQIAHHQIAFRWNGFRFGSPNCGKAVERREEDG